ncbi:hypothetical protein GE061_015666 [Apolygus lucorum]|uniref:Mab-21-like HhH/H2TH-like domain-containing protein n=1 Tax=Apolygus lucorum TaxID=248454 RepID=A0A8S9XLJ4_APOLU|nr:hypothetical protein GE061_015666 [Apolygus lucorum]
MGRETFRMNSADRKCAYGLIVFTVVFKLSAKMGCGPSSRSSATKGLKLPGSNLVFTQGQLQALNVYFSDVIDNAECLTKDPAQEKSLVLIERLIQRLMVGVSILDPRFSSKFLVSLEPFKLNNKPGNSLSYLVRLDELSWPPLYPDSGGPHCQLIEPEGGPQGFARLRMSGPGSEQWAEFVGNQGYLRRDKIQERFVELLAASAGRSTLVGRPGEVDESVACGSPGKVVDATHIHRILEARQQVFYGAGESYSKKFPDPRDFRIAIVEGCSCVRLRVGMIYSSDIGVETDVEVTLVLGIGFTSWPSQAQFPSRIDLTHPDCLLYHQAACTGFYVVPAPPHPTLRCDDRASTWQIRFPAAEQTLLKHYSLNSLPSRVLAVLRALLYEIRATNNGGQVISDYMLKTLLWFRLEEVPGLKEWSHDRLSWHVLNVADRLVAALRTQRHCSYFFPWFNVMLNSPGGGTLHYTEEDYNHDADLLCYQLRRLGDIAPCGPLGGDSDPWRRVETSMIHKWTSVLADLTPPQSTRGTRMAFYPLSSTGYSTVAASQYSIRQLAYIGQLLRSMLTVKQLTLTKVCALQWMDGAGELDSPSSRDDLIYLISSILEQAKSASVGPPRPAQRYRASKTRTKSLSDSYHSAACHLLEEVKSVKSEIDIEDDNVVVREVLKWLYYGMDKDKKNLAPYLRPYLARLFTVSHENCWYLTEWQRRQETDELEALMKFSKLVVSGLISVHDGILDAFHKGWTWAESIMKTSSELADGVELIFTPACGKVVRQKVTESDLQADKTATTSSRSLGRRKAISERKGFGSATLPRHIKPFRECLKSRLHRSKADDEMLTTSHNILRATSPMTQATDSVHRFGNHRGLGSIVHALISLRKFSVLQEVVGILPEGDRAQILDEIQRVSKEVRKPRRLSRTLSNRSQKPSQIYRSTNELSLAKDEEKEELDFGGTLMGTLRELRSRTPQPSVFNPAFFTAPASEAISPLYVDPPTIMGNLSTGNEMVHLMRSTRRKVVHKKEITTNL